MDSHPQNVLIGIDIGSSRTKLLAAGLDGRQIALVTRPTRVTRPAPGAAGFDVGSIVEGVVGGLEELSTLLHDASTICAIGLCSVGEALVGLDRDGRRITPCPTWFDRRTSNTREQAGLTPQDWYELTGMVDDDIYTVHRIQALRHRDPEAVGRVAHWLCLADYLVYVLTGRMVTTASLAARTGLLDRRSLGWCGALLGLSGVDEGQLPVVVASGTVAGSLAPEIPSRTGLPRGIPVTHAGHDHPCAAFACGMVSAGPVLDSAGTAEAVKTVVPHPLDFVSSLEGSFDCYPYLVPGTFILSGHLPYGGALIDWVMRTSFGYAGALTDAEYQSAMDEAESSPPGAAGVRIAPFFEGSGAPLHDRSLTGQIRGLRPSTTRGDLLRGTLEATANWLRRTHDSLSKICGQRLEPVLAAGGGTRNALWLNVKAAMLNSAIKVPDIPEAAALGAASVGGWAVGEFGSAFEAAAKPGIAVREVRPSPALVQAYRGLAQELDAVFEEVSAGSK